MEDVNHDHNYILPGKQKLIYIQFDLNMYIVTLV